MNVLLQVQCLKYVQSNLKPLQNWEDHTAQETDIIVVPTKEKLESACRERTRKDEGPLHFGPRDHPRLRHGLCPRGPFYPVRATQVQTNRTSC